MSYLDANISEYISIINKSVEKELIFITQKDWTILEDLKSRMDLHNIQRLLIGRNVEHAGKLYAMAFKIGEEKHPEVKKTLKTLIQFFDIYESRYDMYVNAQDWESYITDGETNIKNPEKEIQFSSEIAKHIADYQAKLRDIKASEDGVGVVVATQKDMPVPFLMRRNVEEKHPEIVEIMENKLKKDDTKSKERNSTEGLPS
jgi:tRNA-dihydrouridine synthase